MSRNVNMVVWYGIVLYVGQITEVFVDNIQIIRWKNEGNGLWFTIYELPNLIGLIQWLCFGLHYIFSSCSMDSVLHLNAEVI